MYSLFLSERLKSSFALKLETELRRDESTCFFFHSASVLIEDVKSFLKSCHVHARSVCLIKHNVKCNPVKSNLRRKKKEINNISCDQTLKSRERGLNFRKNFNTIVKNLVVQQLKDLIFVFNQNSQVFWILLNNF